MNSSPDNKLQKKLAETVQKAKNRAADNAASQELEQILEIVFSNLATGDLVSNINRRIEDLSKTMISLYELSNNAADLNKVVQRELAYERARLDQQLQDIKSLNKTQPAEAIREWELLFTQSLIEWRLDDCRYLLVEIKDENILETYSTFESALEQISSREGGEEALAALKILVGSLELDKDKNKETLALLHVLIGNLYALDEVKKATEERLKQYRIADSYSPENGSVKAGFGYYYQDETSNKSSRFYKDAINFAPDQPEGFVGLGLLDEANDWWQSSTQWYREAIEAISFIPDKLTYVGRLLAPVSGNLYFELTKWFVDQGDWENADKACQRALELGVRGEGGTRYPQRDLYKLRGDVAAKLGQWAQAAGAYHQAGKEYYWSGAEYGKAIDALSKADMSLEYAGGPIETRMSNYFYWADALQLASSLPKKAPYVKIDRILEAEEKWRLGITSGQPISQWQSWTYLSRGRIASDLAKVPPENDFTHNFDAVVYTERALLFKPTDSIYWADLGWRYRQSELHINALAAARQAKDLAPNDKYAMGVLAGTLINFGGYGDALKIIDDLLKDSQDPAPFKQWRALVFWLQGQFTDSYDLVVQPDVFKPKTTNRWERSIRADIYRLAGEWEKAEVDYQWVLKKARNKKHQSAGPGPFGRAALQLGLHNNDEQSLKKAKELLQKALKHETRNFSSYLYLAIYYLAEGMKDDALQLIENALPKATVPRFVHVARIELKYTESLLKRQQRLTGVQREALVGLRKKIDRIEQDLAENPHTRFDELEVFLRKFPRGSSGWTAGSAALARTYLDHLNFERASLIYQDLREMDDEPLRLIWSDRDRLHAQAKSYQNNMVPLLDTSATLSPDVPQEIVIELSPNLIPANSGDWHFLNEYPQVLRSFIRQEAGLELPGIITRVLDENQTFTPAGQSFRDRPLQPYQIRIREVISASGQVHPDGYFCLASQNDIEGSGVPSADIVPAAHPVTHSPGCWVSRTHLSKLIEQKFVVWDDPLMVPIVHTEAVIRERLLSFLDMQQLETFFTDTKGATDFDHLTEKWWFSAGTITKIQVARLIRALAREQLSLVDWPSILTELDEIGLEVSLPEIIIAVRRKLAKLLPVSAFWNVRSVELPPSDEMAILQFVDQNSGVGSLKLSREEAESQLEVIRTIVNRPQEAQVLLVQDDRARFHTRYLTEMEFPHLLVLTRAEWQALQTENKEDPMPLVSKLAEVAGELPVSAIFPNAEEEPPFDWSEL